MAEQATDVSGRFEFRTFNRLPASKRYQRHDRRWKR
jgi:hypothetical protein